jgi:hypothetical protein
MPVVASPLSGQLNEPSLHAMTKLLLTATIVTCLSPSITFACTLCHSEAAENVRAAIFGPNFWQNVGLTVLPFLVFVAIVACIYPGIPRSTRRTPKRASRENT